MSPNQPGPIFWLLVLPIVGTWIAYLAISNWRDHRRNKRGTK